MIWQPLNLDSVCPSNTSVTTCSSFGYIYLQLLVHLLGSSSGNRKQCDLKDNNGEEYDFIVVGAGSAGCVIANRLSENPNWKVLLLEAGPEQPDVTLVPSLSTVARGSNIDWNYTTEPNGKSCLARPGGRCSWPRGKTMGGSSSINYMAYVRGNKADYDYWAALGNKGWSYGDVLPAFKKSERNVNIEDLDKRYHGATGEQYVSIYLYTDKPSLMMTEAFNEGGLPITDFNGAQQEGTMQAQAFAFAGKRVSTNTAFVQPIRHKRRNLTVKTNAEALQILITENKIAYGIIYSRNGKNYTVYAKKEVIVSAGTINSPKLLMLSGIGPKDHLDKVGIPIVQDLAVGENLHDHVTFSGVFIALPNRTATSVSEDEILQSVKDYSNMKVKEGPLSGNGPLSSISFIKTDPDLIAPDIQYQIGGLFDWREYVDDLLTSERVLIFPTAFYNALLPRIINLVPKSKGVILLNASNPTGAPLIYPNYFGDERDFGPLLKGMRYLLSLEDTKAFKSNGARFVREPLPACKDYIWGTDEYIICLAKAYTTTFYHPVGTCKMGPKWDKKSVVDSRLRVYGVCKLRVVDASIMPIVVRGNTNAPTIMIGERGAQFIIKYWEIHSEAHCEFW